MLLRSGIHQMSRLPFVQSICSIHTIQALHLNQAAQLESNHSKDCGYQISYFKDLVSDYKQFKKTQPLKSTRSLDHEDTAVDEDFDDSHLYNKIPQNIVQPNRNSLSQFNISEKQPTSEESIQSNLTEPNGELKIYIDQSIPILMDHVDHDVGNLAPLVTRNVVLRELVKLGVNLSQLEKVPGVANNLVRLNISLDVIPRLKFLKKLGIKEEEFGLVITRFPKIFKTKLDDMDAVVQYFQSKQFTSESLAKIFRIQPNILGIEVIEIDKQLGCIQKLYHFKGDDMRHVITHAPKLVHLKQNRLQNIHTVLLKQMNFSLKEIQSMVVKHPKLLLTPQSFLLKNFAFLNRSLELDLEYISLYPRALAILPKRLEERIRFLKFLNKLQLDQRKPHFTPLDSIVSLVGKDLATQMGNVGYSEYLRFLKTL